jgi:hypothetical protein
MRGPLHRCRRQLSRCVLLLYVHRLPDGVCCAVCAVLCCAVLAVILCARTARRDEGPTPPLPPPAGKVCAVAVCAQTARRCVLCCLCCAVLCCAVLAVILCARAARGVRVPHRRCRRQLSRCVLLLCAQTARRCVLLLCVVVFGAQTARGDEGPTPPLPPPAVKVCAVAVCDWC